jgi:hypothetical protein
MITRTHHDVTLHIGLQRVYCIYVLLNYVLIHEIKCDSGFKCIVIMHRRCNLTIKPTSALEWAKKKDTGNRQKCDLI